MATDVPGKLTEKVARLKGALDRYPVIAAMRDEAALEAALHTPVQVIFVLSSDIGRVDRVGRAVAAAGKLLFFHLDFIDGLGRDEAGMAYLIQAAHPAGLITTRTGLVQAARRAGVIPLQRLFLLDSQSLSTGLEAARTSKAEVVEVLPGIIPRAVGAIQSQLTRTLIIAGGLVRTQAEAARALAAGAAGVSTSSQALWNLDPQVFRNGGQSTP
ncbi:MAG TPA: glycerol-3-phosphate responsive antiterminator [Symbiobacteriaceae bacterium]|nr:glycerol-3-phosphate responsive antiterminator [Symbiobacteriaceae bacterium]